MTTIRKIILNTPPGSPQELSDIDRERGFRQEACRLNREARLLGETLPEGKPKYTITTNRRMKKLYIINNHSVDSGELTVENLI